MIGAGFRHFFNEHTSDELDVLVAGVTKTVKSDIEEFENVSNGRLDSVTVLRFDADTAAGIGRAASNAMTAELDEDATELGNPILAKYTITDPEAKAGMNEQIAGYKSVSVIEMHPDPG